MSVVRISRGLFEPEYYERVKAKLDASQEALVPAIKELIGLLHFYAGIDPVSNTMINVSVWETVTDARQMESLAAMLALAGEFTRIGINFERPIMNYNTLWEI